MRWANPFLCCQIVEKHSEERRLYGQRFITRLKKKEFNLKKIKKKQNINKNN